MILFTMMIAVAAEPGVQTAPLLDATPETYQAPIIRPFEPPSDFGREQAQGDANADLHRRPLTAPVVVDAYDGSYEVTPTDGQTAYDQGVARPRSTRTPAWVRWTAAGASPARMESPCCPWP